MTAVFQDRLLLLAERLRGNGVLVSTGEVVDASRVLRALVPSTSNRVEVGRTLQDLEALVRRRLW